MPIIYNRQPDVTFRVAVWHITETEATLRAKLPPLSGSELSLLQRLNFEPRRLEWLASRVLLYQLTGLYPSVTYNHNGQPILNDPNVKVSISHTKGYAAIALSTAQTPGIDIEYPSTRIEKVANRFINEAENTFTTAPHRSTQLAIMWCAKEAIFKMAGQPGLIFKNDITIDRFTPQQKGRLKATLQTPTGGAKIIKLDYLISTNYYLIYGLNS